MLGMIRGYWHVHTFSDPCVCVRSRARACVHVED